jgi:hypothetical protein
MAGEVALLTTLVAGLCSVLIVLIGWIGNRIIAQMDALVKATTENHKTTDEKINENHSEIHHRVNGIDKRLVVVETKVAA